jgi:mono/diheme cytochrome c family protein
MTTHTSQRAALATTLALSLGSGCEGLVERVDLERMIAQPRLDAFEPVPWPVAVRRPVDGTVPRERELEPLDLAAPEIPIPVDEALLRRGRDRFERLCAACHGVLGLGKPGVVPHMQLRRPPSLHEPRIREQPPGRLHATIRDGYGLMPGYARWLDARDRWAVVAHLQVLWASQSVRLADLPPAWAERAREELEP